MAVGGWLFLPGFLRSIGDSPAHDVADLAQDTLDLIDITVRRNAFGRQCGDHLFIHPARQHHQGDIARLQIGDAQSVDELRFLAKLCERARQGFATAVHHGNVMPIGHQFGDRVRTFSQQQLVVQCRSANFHHEFQCNPSCSLQPYMTFMFWIAWPAAPLTRLSRQETRMIRWPSAASEKPTSQ